MVVFAGLVLAFTTAVLYAAAVGLQAFEARRAPGEHHLRLALLRRLVRRPRWILGTLLALCGWAAQVGALLLIPLTLVEPALATSLIVLLAIGHRLLDEPVGRRELGSVTAMTVGIGLLAWAAPEREVRHETGVALIAAIISLGVLALVPYVLSRLASPAPLVIAGGAGAAYALDGLATKFFSDDVSTRAWTGIVFWGVGMGLAAGLGTLSEMSALQRRAATQVAPIVFAVTTLVPVALAPVLAGETWSGNPWLRFALAAAIVLIVGGAAVLGTSPAVGAVLEPDGNGTGVSAERDSAESTSSTSESARPSGASATSTTTTSPARGGSGGGGLPGW
jgi:drug/metabolite transporter (DMT)-like permease